MITSSEYAVTITIWVLTLVGIFFGGRAAWRRRRRNRKTELVSPFESGTKLRPGA